MIVLIPAFEPSGTVIALVETLRTTDPDLGLVVIDDGSGPGFDDIFAAVAELGCDVVRYPRNRGKGHALKVGLRHIATNHPGHDVVCADSDGQHRVADILRVADRVRRSPGSMVLGTRSFAGRVPLRSRCGNAVSRLLFRLSTGRALRDTQTGLRGYPATMLHWLLCIRGERYDYEHNVLLRAADAGANFTINRRAVFDHGRDRPTAAAATEYFGLAVGLLALNYLSLTVLIMIGIDLLPSKLLTDVTLFAVSFAVQRRVVFAKRFGSTTMPAEVPAVGPSARPGLDRRER